jgi:hypothetical protein
VGETLRQGKLRDCELLVVLLPRVALKQHKVQQQDGGKTGIPISGINDFILTHWPVGRAMTLELMEVSPSKKLLLRRMADIWCF